MVLLLYTAEHLRDHYFLDYFPTSRKWVGTDHASLVEYQDALPGSRALPLHIRGTDDLTMQIMRRHPRLALDEALARQTSYFARLEVEDPEGLAEGRAQLARDLAANTLPANHADDLPQGDATLLVWRKPMSSVRTTRATNQVELDDLEHLDLGLMEALNPRRMRVMAAPRKYPDELRERAIRMAIDARKDPRPVRGRAGGSLSSSG